MAEKGVESAMCGHLQHWRSACFVPPKANQLDIIPITENLGRCQPWKRQKPVRYNDYNLRTTACLIMLNKNSSLVPHSKWCSNINKKQWKILQADFPLENIHSKNNYCNILFDRSWCFQCVLGMLIQYPQYYVSAFKKLGTGKVSWKIGGNVIKGCSYEIATTGNNKN